VVDLGLRELIEILVDLPLLVLLEDQFLHRMNNINSYLTEMSEEKTIYEQARELIPEV